MCLGINTRFRKKDGRERRQRQTMRTAYAWTRVVRMLVKVIHELHKTVVHVTGAIDRGVWVHRNNSICILPPDLALM